MNHEPPEGDARGVRPESQRPGGVDDILSSFDGSASDLFRQMREHAEHLREWEDRLRGESAKQASEQCPHQSPSWMKHRAERLNAVRRVIRDRLRSLRRAERLVEERERACEHLVEQRRALAVRESEVTRRERRVVRAAARAKASVSVVASVMVLALAVGGGWALSAVVQPREATAQAMIAPVSGEDDTGAWANRVAVAIVDQETTQRIVQELARRKIEGVPSAEAASELIRSRLSLMSPGDGSLTIELRGRGVSETKRTLETIVASTVYVLNDRVRQDQVKTRPEGGVTASPVAVTPERIMLASAIAGGILLLAGLMWLLVRAHAAHNSRILEQLAGHEEGLGA